MTVFIRLISLLSFFFICLNLSVPKAWGKSLGEEETQDLYSQAKTYFRQANEMAPQNPEGAQDLYQKALIRFEKIVREGHIQNGKIFYNIGNTHFHMHNLGQAILYYRKALRYLPNEPNLLQNLNYARSRRQDKIEVPPQQQVLKTLLFWHYDFSFWTRFLLFFTCVTGFWAGAIFRLLFKNKFPRWAGVLLASLALLFLGSMLTESYWEAHYHDGVITTQEVIARKGDGENYQQSFKDPLHAGTEFRLLEQRKEWYQIELLDGRNTWIPQSSSELIW
ncbi:tetratricopeptide repeat protein [Deltaproteobacteria bacterium TL4]